MIALIFAAFVISGTFSKEVSLEYGGYEEVKGPPRPDKKSKKGDGKPLPFTVLSGSGSIPNIRADTEHLRFGRRDRMPRNQYDIEEEQAAELKLKDVKARFLAAETARRRARPLEFAPLDNDLDDNYRMEDPELDPISVELDE